MISKELAQFLIKLFVSMTVIVFCAWISRRLPTLGGLIATMPITSLIVLLWIYSDRPGDFELLAAYTKGVLWGIIPTIFFFLVAYICFLKRTNIWLCMTASSFVWLISALIHQLILGRH